MLAHGRAAGHPVPGQVHALEQVGGGFVAFQGLEILQGLAALGAAAEALAAVLRAAAGGNFAVALPQQRVVAAGSPASGSRLMSSPAFTKKLPVFQSSRLACQGCSRLASCSGKRFGSAAAEKASMASMAEAVWWPWPATAVGREAGDDHVGAALPDHPHHIGQHLLLVPDGEGFLGRFREAEVVGAGEELPAAVDAAGRQQLLRPDDAQPLAQLRRR